MGFLDIKEYYPEKYRGNEVSSVLVAFVVRLRFELDLPV